MFLQMKSMDKDKVFVRVTVLLLSLIAADAAYILCVVVKMTENVSLAAERYYDVPVMAEHILAAVVLYLGCMILAHRTVEDKNGD